MIADVATSYPVEVYGDAVVWEYLKVACKEVSQRLSADRKHRRTEVSFYETKIDAHVHDPNAAPPPPTAKNLPN